MMTVLIFRKRGAAPVCLNASENLMNQSEIDPCEGNGDNREDNDESENQSMASHDGLMIDESFENVKRESLSPPLEKSNDPLYRVVSYDSSTSRNATNEYHQNETFIKHQNYHYRPCDDVHIKSESNPVEASFMNCNGNNVNNDETMIRASDRFGLHSALSHEPVVRHDPNADVKTHTPPMDTCDGNQSVLCNGGSGLNSRMTGTNWMSDLTSYNGW